MGVGWGGVGWDINVHVPCVHTWLLRCCYVTGHGLGGKLMWESDVYTRDTYIYIHYIYIYIYI